MKHTLQEDQLRLLREVIGNRCPELSDRVESADIGRLTWQVRQNIINAIGQEFAASGVGRDWEPTQRGLQLEELLDIVNRPNLKSF